ncbi:MAG: hypothetical protein QGG54_21600, partial [Gammaproteobacteria bacterium]|nr:hypothetical protein [Gammaproteobacteria bacterium]
DLNDAAAALPLYEEVIGLLEETQPDNQGLLAALVFRRGQCLVKLERHADSGQQFTQLAISPVT